MGKNKNRNRKPTKQKLENLPKEITPVGKPIDDKAQIKQEEKLIKKDPANNNDPKNIKNTASEDLKQPPVQGNNDAAQVKKEEKPDSNDKKSDATATKNISTEIKPDAKENTNTVKKTDAAEKTDSAKKSSHTENIDSTKTKADPAESKSAPANKPKETETKVDSRNKKSDSLQQKPPADVQKPEPAEAKPQDDAKAPAPAPEEHPEKQNGTAVNSETTTENGSEKGRVFDSRILSHDQFESPQKWYIDVKTDSIAPSYCTNCDATINLGDIHLYSYGLLLLPSLDKVVKTKLRFCTTSKCITNIKGSNHNIRDIPEMKVIQGPSVIMTEEEEQALKEQSFVIVKSWHMGLSELQPFKFEENSNNQSNTDDKPTDPEDAKSSTPDETVAEKKPRTPVKVPEISYDGTDAETTAALREELKNTLTRSPIKATTTPIKETATTTKDTKNNTNNVAEKGCTEGSTKSSKKTSKSSRPSKTAKSSKTTSADKDETSKDDQKEQNDTATTDKAIEATASVGQGGTGNGVRKEDPLDAAQTSQASCSMM